MKTRSPGKRLAILTAANELFTERGFQATSVDAVAERAKVSKRTVYNHFTNKAGLFEGLIEMMKAEGLHSVEPPTYEASTPLDEQLLSIVNAQFKTMFEPAHTRFVRMLMGEIIRNPELSRDFQREMAVFDEMFVPWILAAQEDGRLDVPDPVLASRMFWNSLMGLGHWPRVLSSAGKKPARWNEIVKEWIALFLGRYATK